MKAKLAKQIGYTSLAQVISFLSTILLANKYSPESFGLASSFLAIIVTLSIVATCKYELAIVLPKQQLRSIRLVIATHLLSTIVCAGTYVTILFIMIFRKLDVIYLLIPIGTFFVSSYVILDKFNNRNGSYNKMGLQQIIRSIFDFTVSYTVAASVGSIYGLIYGLLSGFIISSLFMMYLYKDILRYTYIISWRKSIALIIEYKNFPKYTMPQALLNSFAANAFIFIIPIFFDNYVLGLYSFGMKFAQAPLSIISNSLYNIFSKDIASFKNDQHKLFIYYKKNLNMLLLLSVPIYFILVSSGDLFLKIFGASWAEAGNYIEILAPMLIFTFLAGPFAFIPHFFSRQKTALKIEIFSIGLKFITIVVGSNYFDFLIVLQILTIVSCCINIYSLLWYYRLVKP